jgi:Uma2 family endonuclease
VIEGLGNLQELRRGDVTPAMLDEVPRDGRQYEVVDGRLLVTGAQPPAHRAAVIALMVRLKQACPPGLLVAVGSLDFRPTRGLSLRPDVLVCNRQDADAKFLTTPPHLAVEVLSPATRVTDVVLKRGLYEQSGVPSYWLLDPINQELTILELTNDRYTCQAVVQGEETFTTDAPFPVHLTPAELTT